MGTTGCPGAPSASAKRAGVEIGASLADLKTMPTNEGDVPKRRQGCEGERPVAVIAVLWISRPDDANAPPGCGRETLLPAPAFRVVDVNIGKRGRNRGQAGAEDPGQAHQRA